MRPAFDPDVEAPSETEFGCNPETFRKIALNPKPLNRKLIYWHIARRNIGLRDIVDHLKPSEKGGLNHKWNGVLAYGGPIGN